MSASEFDWLREPVLNPYTRLAVSMNPARGILRAVGYDLTGDVLPAPVTEICELELSAADRQASANDPGPTTRQRETDD